jgi:ubiquitin C-terminal hydrolase
MKNEDLAHILESYIYSINGNPIPPFYYEEFNDHNPFNENDQIVPYVSGLNNIGNTCYMNAILQALFTLPDFIRGISKSKDVLSIELKKLFNDMENRQVCHPSEFRSKFVNLYADFNNYQQHDSPNFINSLFDHISSHNSMKLQAKLPKFYDDDTIEEMVIKSNTSKRIIDGYNFIWDMFGYETITIRRCDTCFNIITKKVTPANEMMILAISPGAKTLNDLINSNFKPETLTENLGICKFHKQQISQTLIQYIYSFGKYLHIQLKRFETVIESKNNNAIYVAKKIETVIDIPQTLKIMSESQGEMEYELLSTVYHRGQFGSGHYYSVCKRKDGFYIFDDERTYKVNNVTSENAYEIFYVRRK